MGLGLAIIKQLIDDCEGEIYLESEPQKGSIFTCIIPSLSVPIKQPIDRLHPVSCVFRPYIE
jgi:signal transduction histidine kinase